MNCWLEGYFQGGCVTCSELDGMWHVTELYANAQLRACSVSFFWTLSVFQFMTAIALTKQAMPQGDIWDEERY